MITEIKPHILLAGLWILWCGLHSLMIAPGFLAQVRSRWGQADRYYRLVYNGIAVITLLPVIWYGETLSSSVVWAWNGGWRVLQGLLILTAMYLFRAGARGYDLKVMLGLQQLEGHAAACNGIGSECGLSEAGILGKIRHPWYTAGMLIIWARDWSWSVICVNLVLTLYFIAGSHWEERKLRKEFGSAYADYQSRVPMFFPRVLKR